ncbi:FAD-dependent oxidoreductase [soil metagenome]
MTTDSTLTSLMSQAATSRSFWLESAVPLRRAPLAKLPGRVKLAIVGAGLAGVSVGCEFMRRGMAAEDIVILEGAAPGHGASGRNGGFVLTFPGTVLCDWIDSYGEEFVGELMRKNRRNRDLIRETVLELGVPHQNGGSYYIAGHAEEEAWLQRCATFLSHDAASDAALGPPPPHSPSERPTLFVPGDFGIQPADYVHRRLDASAIPYAVDCAVTDCKRDGGGVLLTTSRGPVHADRVVFATNVYLPLVLDYFQRHIPITPKRNQVVLFKPANAADRVWGDAIYYANEGYEYWRQLPDGRILLGGLRNRDVPGEATIELGKNNAILEFMKHDFIPKLTLGAPYEIERTWSGIMGFTADEIPVCGFIPETDERVAYLGGFSGYGLGFHRAVVEDLVGMMEGEKTATPFSPERFLCR